MNRVWTSLVGLVRKEDRTSIDYWHIGAVTSCSQTIWIQVCYHTGTEERPLRGVIINHFDVHLIIISHLIISYNSYYFPVLGYCIHSAPEGVLRNKNVLGRKPAHTVNFLLESLCFNYYPQVLSYLYWINKLKYQE